jgi:hypothetical protein
MMIKKFLVATAFVLFSSFSNADLLSTCNSMASDLNKQLPMQVDNITTWKATICMQAADVVTLRYMYTINVASNKVTQKDLTDNVRQAQLNQWCSSPDLRKILNLVNIEAVYNDQLGIYIGKLVHSKSMCK